jgi:hypothetical protein
VDLSWVYQFVTTAVVGIIAYFLKDIRNSTDDKIIQLLKEIKEMKEKAEIDRKDNADWLDQLREDLSVYKEEVSREFVRKTDYYQAQGDISRKIDRIYDILMDMKKN